VAKPIALFKVAFFCCRRPFTGIDLSETQLQIAEKLLQEEMQNTTIHFGEGRINPSTVACVFAKVEERLTGKLPKLPDVKWGYSYALKAIGIKTGVLDDLE
jgi:hypothetical protein